MVYILVNILFSNWSHTSVWWYPLKWVNCWSVGLNEFLQCWEIIETTRL